MLGSFDDRQQGLLRFLLKKSEGTSIDEISEELGITRPATRQHLARLERHNYVERGEPLITGGRPSQTYRLSKRGYELFPKQYSWFSEVLIETLKEKLGDAELRQLFSRLGSDVGEQVAHRVHGETMRQKVQQVVELMNDLAYEAETAFTGKEMPGSPPVIEAMNCVYHAVASRFPEICQFDIALLTRLTGANIVHEQCIVRGGSTCRFRFNPPRAQG